MTRPGPGRRRPRPPPDHGRDRLPAGAGRGHRAPGQPGWDNAEKDGGRKRHIAVDATGLVLAWADAGYAGKLATWAASLKIQLEIVRKRDAHAFEVLLPRSWVVERPVPGSPLTVAAPATTNGCSKATRPWSYGPWSP